MSVITFARQPQWQPDLHLGRIEKGRGAEHEETWTIGISFPARDVPRRPFPRPHGDLDVTALFDGAASGGPVASEEGW
jgi:hypothetical protein